MPTRRPHPLLLLLLLLALLPLGAAPATAQGMLIPEDDGARPLRQTEQTVRLEVTDDLTVAHVKHTFSNDSGELLEAVYYFTLPAGAATTGFSMWIEGERVKGQVLPRAQARSIYDKIVSRLRDPALLESADGELFTASVYPIAPYSSQEIEVEFALPNPKRGGAVRIHYPLSESEATAPERLLLDATVRCRGEITSIQTPFDEARKRIDGNIAEVHLERRAGQREDIELLIDSVTDDLGLSIVTFDPDGTGGKDGYFMATLGASTELARDGALDRQVTIVIDRSGSMSGEKMRQAKAMLRSTIDSFSGSDTFNLISFSRDAEPLFDAPRPATASNRDRALKFVEAMTADGDTNIEAALRIALEQPTERGRPHAVVFVTDGLPTRGERDIDALLRQAERGSRERSETLVGRRIFSFGVGYDVNTRLLDGLARSGNGESGYVRPSEDISDVVGSFVSGLASPLATELRADFGDGVSDLYPRTLPDLYRGRPITVFGRFSSPMSQEVTLRGRTRSGDIRTSFGAEFGASSDSANAPFVGNLWASRKVADLLETIRIHGATEERVETVTTIATEWGIVTPYTSFLAVPDDEKEPEEPEEPPQPEIDPTPLRRIHYEVPVGRSREEARGGKSARSAEDADERMFAPSRAAAAAPAMEVGREAVENSISANRSKTSLRADVGAGGRFASGRTFVLRGGVWMESGVESRSATRTIVAWSQPYFDLLRDHPELREALALGERVRLRLGAEVIEVTAR